MAFSFRKLFASPTPEELSSANWQRGKVVLYTLSFVATAVSMSAVAWASNEFELIGVLIAASGLGLLVSSLPGKRRWRTSWVIVPLTMLAIWMMRGDLLAVLSGGSLFPIARLLTVFQALVSFNLQSIRGLYDSLLLNLMMILLASEGAPSFEFLVFLLVFGVVALTFLAVAHLVSETTRLRWAVAPSVSGIAMSFVGIVVLTLGASLAVFLVLPQTYRAVDANPLPSRLNLASRQPAPSSDSPGRGSAPFSQLLPSRNQDLPSSPLAGRAPSDEVAGGSSGSGPVPSNGRLATSSDAGPAHSQGEPSYAQLGYTGDHDKDVVMYVRSPLASYWRGQILVGYDGTGWKASSQEQQLEVDPSGGLQFRDAPAEASPTGTYVQSFFLKIPQPNAVFTGYSPGRILFEYPAKEGDGPTRFSENMQRLRQARSFRVISAVPYLTPDELRRDSIDRNELKNLDMPSAPSRVKALAQSIVAGATSDYERAARLEQYLLNEYTYDLRVSAMPGPRDAVDNFLFERRAGYCAQFATAMAVMARLVELPARVVTGYLPGDYNSLLGVHVVRLKDAHAWVEIKFREYGWVPFDPTPRPDSPWALDTGYTSATKELQQVMREKLTNTVIGGSSSLAKGIGNAFSSNRKAWEIGPLSLAMVSSLTVGLVILRRRHGRWGRVRRQGYTLLPGKSRDEIRNIYRKALTLLEKKGYPKRQPCQSPGEYIATLESMELTVPEPFRQISRQATNALYNPRPLDISAMPAAKGLSRELRSIARLRRNGCSKGHGPRIRPGDSRTS